MIEHFPIRAGDRVLDAGGGSGMLADRIAAAFPKAEIHGFDLPNVFRPRAGVRAYDGDLFGRWPAADVIILARVLHDWSDEKARDILRRAHDAAQPGGRLAIIELILDERGFRGGMCDLHLLAVTGGRERMLTEFIELLASAGWRFVREHRGPTVPSLLIAER